MARDFYAVLALSRSASEDQIRQRFRELARARHPDRFRGQEKVRAEKDFQDITEAFNALIDPARRRRQELPVGRFARPGSSFDHRYAITQETAP